MASPLTALACHRSSAHVPTENRVAVCPRRLPAAVAGEQRGRPSPAWRRHTRRCDYLAISAVRPVTWSTRHRQVVDALREGARLQTPGHAEGRQSGLTAHLVAPDPATSPVFWGGLRAHVRGHRLIESRDGFPGAGTRRPAAPLRVHQPCGRSAVADPSAGGWAARVPSRPRQRHDQQAADACRTARGRAGGGLRRPAGGVHPRRGAGPQRPPAGGERAMTLPRRPGPAQPVVRASTSGAADYAGPQPTKEGHHA
jgi:hypothetical protein